MQDVIQIKKAFFLTLLCAGLVLISSVKGVFVPATYFGVLEGTLVPEAQGRDLVSLVLLPVLLLSAFSALRGSWSAFFAWGGTLVYYFFMYGHYAFSGVHTGLFFLYVPIAGAGFYSMALILHSLFLHEKRLQGLEHSRKAVLFAAVSFFVIACADCYLRGAEVLPLFGTRGAVADLQSTALVMIFLVPAVIIVGVHALKGENGYLMVMGMAASSLFFIHLALLSGRFWSRQAVIVETEGLGYLAAFAALSLAAWRVYHKSVRFPQEEEVVDPRQVQRA